MIDLFRSSHPVLLAPMAGYTDSVFRSLCMEFGCDLTVSEMVSAKGLIYENRRTQEYLELGNQESHVCIQLFGHEPEILASAASLVCDELGDRLYSIDINMGCPAPKIVSNGDGSALLKNPVLAGKITKAVKTASRVPVTVKIRKGFDSGEDIASSFAMMLEDSGADSITVHPRTRTQQYSGNADWSVIRAVKRSVSIPVVGNGDIHDSTSALKMLQETGCDGLMIGRAALGNPWIFSEIKASLSGSFFSPPSESDRFKMAYRHAEQIVSVKGTHALVELRKHIPLYLKGVRCSKEIRQQLNSVETLAQLRHLLLDR